MLLKGTSGVYNTLGKNQRGRRMGPDQSPSHLDPPVQQTAPISSCPMCGSGEKQAYKESALGVKEAMEV